MGHYVTLTLRTSMYDRIVDAIMGYCIYLDRYSDIEDIVHLIDFLEEEYEEDMAKQNKEFIQWQEREDLFRKRFDQKKIIDDEVMFEYKNYNKINNIIERYKEKEILNTLNEKQQFNLVLDIIEVFKED